MPLTPAEKMKRRREKLKKEGKYEEYKAVQRERERKSYQKRKEELMKLPIRKRMTEIKKRREIVKQKVAKHRRLKSEKIESSITSPVVAYKTASTLGKAVARARSALPKSPRKKKLVIRKLFDECDFSINSHLIIGKDMHSNAMSEETIAKVKNFYERDDISRQAPGIKDVVTIRSGNKSKVKMQIRHLSSSIKETYQMFTSEFGKIIGKSKFAELRPHHVFLSNKLQHNVCLCKYHENYISAVNAFHKNLPSFPAYTYSFIESNIICKNATDDCWLNKCQSCRKNLCDKLDAVLENTSPSIIKWHVWKDEIGKSLMKVPEEGTACELAIYINEITPHFLKHSFIKRKQAETFKQQRENQCCSSFDPKKALIQVDFSENFTCIAQDEVQSFHWVQPQVSLFTVSLWHSGNHFPIVIVSDHLDHSKQTVVAYVDRVLEEIPNCVEEINVWSDGPSSQFKNRYIASSLGILQKQHNKAIIWNYFATSHGKGAVDGIGGAIKRQVKNSVLQRQSIVFNAYQFADVAKKVSSVIVIEMTKDDIEHRNTKMNLEKLFKSATPIPGISEAHVLCSKNNVIETQILTRYLNMSVPQNKIIKKSKSRKNSKSYKIYSSSGSPPSEDEDRQSQFSRLQYPTVKDIKHGTYILVKFDGPCRTNYRYVAVCQSEVEDDGDVKIMCLKMSGESGHLFKVDEADVSYVQFDQILQILPTPSLVMKGNRVLYNFSVLVDVFEKA